LICLGVVTCAIGFVMDAFLENTLIHWGMYIYAQVIPWAQYSPARHSSSADLGVVLGVLSLMVRPRFSVTATTPVNRWRKACRQSEAVPTRPVLGTFLVMFAIINVLLLRLRRVFWVIKVSHAATSVACPWPYPEAKVYDPQGYYEKAGAQGPYSVGIWSTWASGEPNGPAARPSTATGPGCVRTREDEWLRLAASSIHRRFPGTRVRNGRAPISRGWRVVRGHAHTRAGHGACCGRRLAPLSTTIG